MNQADEQRFDQNKCQPVLTLCTSPLLFMILMRFVLFQNLKIFGEQLFWPARRAPKSTPPMRAN
jgi:hypothetical protein